MWRGSNKEHRFVLWASRVTHDQTVRWRCDDHFTVSLGVFVVGFVGRCWNASDYLHRKNRSVLYTQANNECTLFSHYFQNDPNCEICKMTEVVAQHEDVRFAIGFARRDSDSAFDRTLEEHVVCKRAQEDEGSVRELRPNS